MTLFAQSIEKIYDGVGRIACQLHGASNVVFSELSSTYPLKLLSPRTLNDVAIVYILTYGGGLVGGDLINLSVAVGSKSTLVLLTQVSILGGWCHRTTLCIDRAPPKYTRRDQVSNLHCCH